MQRHCTAALLIFSMAGICGCKSVSERMMKSQPKESRAYFRSSYVYRLDDERLAQMKFEGEVEADGVNVTYQAGLEQQAQCLAGQIGELMEHVESSMGVDICLCAKVYLLRVDVAPSNCEINLKTDPNCLVMPLFVSVGEESCEAITAVNSVYPAVFVHEMAEMSLVFGDGPGVVLPDAMGQVLMFRPKLLNYTRWFREGFASYAGYLAYRKMRPQIESKYPSIDWEVYRDPFSSLARVDGGLFDWHNYSPARMNRDYYSGALGLFLLICERFGEDSIRRIVGRMQEEEFLNGQDLIRVVNDVLDTDIEELVSEFTFPELGWQTAELTRAVALNEGLDVERGLLVTEVDPNGPAGEAGIREGDAIVKVNDRLIRNELDLELALYDSLDAQAVDVTVWRKGGGEKVMRVRLGELQAM